MEREPDKEAWRSAIAGQVVLKQYNQRGELADLVVGSGRTFHLSPKERRINQEMAANEDLDMFSNGTLVPVSLIEGTEDAAALLSNPNIIGESDMKEMFGTHWKKFDEHVSQITNESALKRLLEMSKDPETNATVRQSEIIQARLAELNPNAPNEHVQMGEGRAVTMRPVSPT